jgi:hypothetical protein
VSVLLAWGRPGPLSVHSPEACYGAAGFSLSGPSERYSVTDAAGSNLADFWKSTFTRQDSTVSERLLVLHAWNRDGVWHAPQYPRWKLAGAPVLHKLYVTQSLSSRDEVTVMKDTKEFLQVFMPQVNEALKPAS